jgi:hypothetical protein
MIDMTREMTLYYGLIPLTLHSTTTTTTASASLGTDGQ